MMCDAKPLSASTGVPRIRAARCRSPEEGESCRQMGIPAASITETS